VDRPDIETLLPCGYKLINPEKGNRGTPLTLECPNKHTWSRARLGNISMGVRCPQCKPAVRYKLSLDEVKERCLSNGWECLSTDYVGAFTPLHVKCVKCGLERKAQLTNIRKSCAQCRKLSKRGAALSRLITVLESRGHVLLNDGELTETRITKQRIKVRCHHHHVYENSYQGIVLDEQGCGFCYGNKRLSVDVIKSWLDHGYQVHGEYYNNQSRLLFTCPNGHEYHATWATYQKGHRCPVCHGANKLIDEQVHERLKELSLQWVDGHYENVDSILTLKCENEKHATFQFRFRNIYCGGHKCPECKQQLVSMAEKEIADWLENAGFQVERSHRELLSNGREVDIYLPQHKLGVEYCGLFFHQEGKPGFGKDRHYHAAKYTELAASKIRLLTIFEDEWQDKKDVVKSLILSKLNKAETSVYARSCLIRKVAKREFQRFLRDNHLQGETSAATTLCYGLYHDDKLVQCITFGFGHRQNMDSKVMYIDRVCTRVGYTVTGGVSRLLKAVREEATMLGRCGLRTYSDRRYSDGALYKALGFSLVGSLPPSYHYVKGGVRKSKQSLKLKPEERALGVTEAALRLSQGYGRIWDCGKDVWETRW